MLNNMINKIFKKVKKFLIKFFKAIKEYFIKCFLVFQGFGYACVESGLIYYFIITLIMLGGILLTSYINYIGL